eukprot:TRINITY_DN798_c0_g3_i2.p1 TRINITY_DN798_c0_g3~~TRINITY_DN798_c0_g3_i2.p1  ORF type:complete len:311 (-),score=83.76 TRINITY_DN798_c0_g3_i2:1307-2239(-)
MNNSMNPPPIELNITIKNNYVGYVPQSMESTQKRFMSFNPRRKKAITNSTSVKAISSTKLEGKKETMPAIRNTYKIANEKHPKIKISLGHLQKLLEGKTLKEKLTLNCVNGSKGSNLRIRKQNSRKMLGVTNPVKYNNFVEPTSVARNRETIDDFPLTGIQALRIFSKELTPSEKSEILDYDMIYYMGNGVARLNFENTGSYDDENGDYNTYVGEQLGYRYEIIDILGKGSFGQAIKCLDHKKQKLVALKIIKSNKRFYHQALVEVKILKYIRDNDPEGKANVVKILDSFLFREHIVKLIVMSSVFPPNS